MVSGFVYDIEPTGDGFAVRRVPLAQAGARRLRGWGHPRRSPAKRWATIYPNGGYLVEHRGWLDHLCRLRYRDARTVYRAEPYDLDPSDLDDLALLREDGWRVYIGGAPCHHPTTIVVSIDRAETPAA
jgi:hypothetical protein